MRHLDQSPIDNLPQPLTIREWIGRRSREMALLRQLLRLSQAARDAASAQELRNRAQDAGVSKGTAVVGGR
jgi:hypothetical protein